MYHKIKGGEFPFWNDLSESDQAKIAQKTAACRYAKGDLIHKSGRCTGMIFIERGCLRVYMLSEEGRDITLYRLYAGDVCILSAPCLLPEITFDVFVDAEETCECRILDGSAAAEVAENNLQFKLFAYETALSRFSEAMWVMQQILFMKVDQRLAVFLWDETVRTDSDFITLTQEQIAKYICSAREVVSRMLKYFMNEKIVEVARKGIKIIDRQRLKQIARR